MGCESSSPAGRSTAGRLGVVKPNDTRSSAATQPVGQVCRVEGDREWFADEIDHDVLFGPADVVGTGRQPQHIVGEFHPDLRTAIGD